MKITKPNWVLHKRPQPLKTLPIGTRYRVPSNEPHPYDDCFVWTKTGKTTSKLNPNQKIGTRHDNRKVVVVVD
jgi:hypothetical protein